MFRCVCMDSCVMSVYICVCMIICRCVCMCVFMHVCVYVCVHVYSVRVYGYITVGMPMCMYYSMYANVCV